MFNPPFCPNDLCPLHRPDVQRTDWFYRTGYHRTKAFGKVPRFKCRSCGKSFSSQTFSIDYYVKQSLDYQRIFKHLCSGSGIRSTARWLLVSHQAIINRIGRLGRQSVALQAEISQQIRLDEDLVTDGFESFVKDQYQPNNIHLLVGSHSQFLYSFNYSHLKRKGRMTEDQKAERMRREEQLIGKRVSITDSFTYIIDEVEQLLKNRIAALTTLFSDEKEEYRRVIRRSDILNYLHRQGSFFHKTISSRKARTRKNPLFPVNYLDRQLRKDNANHVRETMQFSQSVSNCLERLAVYQLYHNFFKPFRVDSPTLRKVSHAQMAGIEKSLIELKIENIFSVRKFFSHQRLSWSQLLVWSRMVGSLHCWDGGYRPKYVWM